LLQRKGCLILVAKKNTGIAYFGGSKPGKGEPLTSLFFRRQFVLVRKTVILFFRRSMVGNFVKHFSPG